MPKWSARSTCAPSAPPATCAAGARGGSAPPAPAARRPQRAACRPRAPRQRERRCRCRGRCRRPAPGARGERPIRSTASTVAAEALGRGISSPLSGPTSSCRPSAVATATAAPGCAPTAPTSGSTTARWTAGGHVGDRVAQHERARAHVVAGDLVGDVDHARARAARRDHAVTDADELVGVTVVGQEPDDRRVHRPVLSARGVPAALRVLASPSSAASTPSTS